MSRSRLDESIARYHRELRKLESLRADYRYVTASRFFGLRELARGAARLFRITLPQTKSEASGAHAALVDPADLAQLKAFWHERVEQLPLSDTPVVSIVIPVYNHCATTIGCLQSIAARWFDTLAVEIILVDDASTDQTPELAKRLPGLILVRSKQNGGFIEACNRGAAIARGRYICFLNNDTEVSNGWLDALVSTAEGDAAIGAVGGKLVFPDGRLQEAGGIIYRDGRGENYGRYADPEDPRYNYVRDVDYCSGAALLVRTELFKKLGGFNPVYAPAYYEDADLCFAIREAGYRVVYQPRSVITHHEGVTSGTDPAAGTKRHQEINRPKFRARWQRALDVHAELGDAITGARRLRSGETILVVDSYVPIYDQEAGSLRLFEILKILLRCGYHVIFLPDNYAGLQPYTEELQALGIEVLHHVNGGSAPDEALQEVLPIVDVAWICRPELFQKYRESIRRNGALKLVFDTIDLHFLREQRAQEVLGIGDPQAWRATQARELEAAHGADAVVTVSEPERAFFTTAGIENVHVIPTIYERRAGVRAGYRDRAGILFIGGYNHPPNLDAGMWLAGEIMPLVWQTLPKLTLTLLGSRPPNALRALANDRIVVPGYVPNVDPFFEHARVFVAPLRFGAGLKGKIGHSFAFGLPVVTTPIGAEGFEIEDQRDYLCAQSAPEIARAIVRLYEDEVLWTRLSAAADAAVARFEPESVAPRVRALLHSLAPATL